MSSNNGSFNYPALSIISPAVGPCLSTPNTSMFDVEAFLFIIPLIITPINFIYAPRLVELSVRLP